MYIPGLRKNLLSVGKLVEEGHYTLFSSRRYWVFSRLDPNHIILTRTREGRNSPYRLSPSTLGRLSSPNSQHPIFLAPFNQPNAHSSTPGGTPASASPTTTRRKPSPK
jgi:hypothetical protein